MLLRDEDGNRRALPFVDVRIDHIELVFPGETELTVTLCNWENGETLLYSLDPEKLEKWLGLYRLGHLFTSGELDAMAQPDVEPVEDSDFKDLPSEDAALSKLSEEIKDGEND